MIAFGPATLGAAGADWTFRFRENGDVFDSFDPETLSDAYLIVGYTVQPAAP